MKNRLFPNGVVYVGDGAWGVGTREPHDPQETWYLKRAESVRHFILVTIHGQHQHLLTVDRGQPRKCGIDEYPRNGLRELNEGGRSGEMAEGEPKNRKQSF